MRKGFAAIVLLLGTIILVAIIGGVYYLSKAKSGYPSPIQPTTPTLFSSPSPSGIAVNGEIVLSDNDNGSTITVSLGAKFKVILHNTYWTFDNLTDEQILKLTGKPIYATDTKVHILGTGAGTVTAEYQTTGLGKTSISASRTVCGEGLRCVGNQGSFLLHVVVN